jgi:prephenate dehydrogenase
MSAVIIGIDGGMGKWLKNHLESLGFTIEGFDERRGDDPSIITRADLVVVSVPVGLTADVIKFAVKHMRKDATLMEIASLKSGIHEEMVEVSKKGFNMLSVHPMFGPSVTGLEEKTVTVIPVSCFENEVSQTRHLFPGASIVPVEPERHDRLMSLILSLPYLVNLALAGTMMDEDLTLLRKLSGTSFALQYTLIQSVAAENTSLVYALLSENCFLGESSERFIENLSKILQKMGSVEEFSQLHDEIKESMRRDIVHNKAHEIRQAAYDRVRPLLR